MSYLLIILEPEQLLKSSIIFYEIIIINSYIDNLLVLTGQIHIRMTKGQNELMQNVTHILYAAGG